MKLPVRLNAKPTGPYNAKKGKRGYVRPRDKRLISPELLEYGEGC